MLTVEYGFSTYNRNKRIILNELFEPRLYNSGETVVRVDGVRILPGDSFSFGVTGAKTVGAFNIVFEDEATKLNEVRLFYGTLVNCSF